MVKWKKDLRGANCTLCSITTYRLSVELSNFWGILLEIYKLKGRKPFLSFKIKHYQKLLVKNENICGVQSSVLDSFRDSESTAQKI